MVHDGDGAPALVLLLRDLEERNDGRFLVIGRIAGDDLVRDRAVGRGERERDRGVVVRAVAVLPRRISDPRTEKTRKLTSWSASDRATTDDENVLRPATAGDLKSERANILVER